jgi:hypothetical protein
MAAKPLTAKLNKIWPWLAAALIWGTLLGFIMLMLSLRFYISITHPAWIIIAGSLLFALPTGLLSLQGSKPSIVASILTVIGSAILVALSAYSTIYLLLSIYPPNFS